MSEITPEEHTQDTRPAKHSGERYFGWTSHPKAGLYTFIFVGVLAAGLALADFFVHRHEYIHLAEFKMFYALSGFAAFGGVVLSGWPLRKLLGRPENYYEPEEEADNG